jgi:ribose transport system permease protein
MSPAELNSSPSTVVEASAQQTEPEKRSRRRFTLGLDRFSGLYVWAALIVLFGFWVPDTFLRSDNLSIVANESAITAMLALGIGLPLAAGVFDLSFAGVAGISVAVNVWAQVSGWNAILAALAACTVAATIGAINGFLVVRLNISSFIATLGMSSILIAVEYKITGGQIVSQGLSNSFVNLFSKRILSIPLPFWVMLILAAVVFIIMDYLPVGRYLFAVGGNPVAARLAGVRVNRIVFGSLVASSTVAGIAGVVLAAQLRQSTPDVGPAYLIPAFSAVFLGSTQIKPGRVNVLGTLIAVYLLATGVNGLLLAGAQSYITNLFNGGALIIAVALAQRSARRTT